MGGTIGGAVSHFKFPGHKELCTVPPGLMRLDEALGLVFMSSASKKA